MRLAFQPTKDRILIEPIHQPAQVGLLHVPEAHRETKSAEGVVVAIGPRNRLPIKVGDRVFTDRYAECAVHIGKGRYRLLLPEAILAVIEEE